MELQTERKIKTEEVLACRTCLSTELKLVRLTDTYFLQNFFFLSGVLMSPDDILPDFVCIYCYNQLQKFLAFRARCCRAQVALKKLQTESYVSTETIKNLNIKKNKLLFLTKTSVQTIKLPTKSNKSKKYEIFTLKENKNGEFITDSEISDDECLRDIIKNTDKAKEKLNSNEKINSKDDNGSISDKSDYQFLKEFEIDSDMSNEKLFDKDDNISDVSDDIFDNYKSLIEDIKKEIKSESIDEGLELKDSLNELKNKEEEIIKKELKPTTKRKRKRKSIVDPTLIVPEFKSLVTNCKNYNFFKKENIEKFCKDYEVDIKMLSKEEQMKDLESRKKAGGYVTQEFKCDLCCRGFVVESGYKSHMAYHDESRGEFTCEICAFRYKTKAKMLTHQRKTHALDFVCRICGKATKNTKNAVFHYNHHRGAKISCKYCDKEFTQRAAQMEHMRIAHGSIRCNICGMVLQNEKGIRLHRFWQHQEVVESNCDTCKGLFYSNEALKKHNEDGCSNNNKYCSHCGSSFTDQELLQSHIEEIHWKTENTYKCTKCPKTFDSKRKLQFHLREKGLNTHSVEEKGSKKYTEHTPLICEVCGLCLKSTLSLKYHLRTHSDERPYKCDKCPKTFRLLNTYHVHMDTHANVRRYKCPICPKTFTQAGHRTTHVRIHKNERPYVCKTCSRSFVCSGNLKHHIQGVHMGIKRVRKGANVSCEPGTSEH